MVFLSTFLTATGVSWVAVRATYDFLEERMDRTYPVLLDGTARRVTAWLDEGRGDLAYRLERGRLGANPGRRLSAWQRDSRFFDAMVLTDPRGRVRARAGADEPLPRPADGADPPREAGLWAAEPGRDGARVVASLEVPGAPAGTLLHGVFRREPLEALLAGTGIGEAGRLVLVDARGRVQSRSRTHAASVGYPVRLEELALGGVQAYRSHVGEHLVGAARPLGELGWYLLLEEPFRTAFAPVFQVATWLFAIDLSILLLFSFLAYQITAAIVRPIEALAQAARSIARGHLETDLPDAERDDEIGLLTRAFRDMTEKLLSQKRQMEESNSQLTTRNEELHAANEVLEQLSITDGLTKLHNHRFFQDHLSKEIKRAQRTGDPLSMLICDLDDFKKLNDRRGHKAGDELLLGLARMLNEQIRETDFVARYGGEEFVVLAPQTDLHGAVSLAEKVRMAVEEASFILDDSKQLTKATLSIGVALYRGDRKSFFQQADEALYRAKAAGKNCVVAEEAPG